MHCLQEQPDRPLRLQGEPARRLSLQEQQARLLCLQEHPAQRQRCQGHPARRLQVQRAWRLQGPPRQDQDQDRARASNESKGNSKGRGQGSRAGQHERDRHLPRRLPPGPKRPPAATSRAQATTPDFYQAKTRPGAGSSGGGRVRCTYDEDQMIAQVLLYQMF